MESLTRRTIGSSFLVSYHIKAPLASRRQRAHSLSGRKFRLIPPDHVKRSPHCPSTLKLLSTVACRKGREIIKVSGLRNHPIARLVLQPHQVLQLYQFLKRRSPTPLSHIYPQLQRRELQNPEQRRPSLPTSAMRCTERPIQLRYQSDNCLTGTSNIQSHTQMNP
jgi:hypothetical protein